MYIKELKIGDVKVKNNLILAPMAGVTDSAFRKICVKYGVGLVVSEMVSAKGIVYGDKKTLELIQMDIPNMPRMVQIFGSEPDIMSKAIKIIEDKVDIIDINMGCPVPKIVSNGEGSALLKNPKLIGEIVKACVNATTKPVTVKIRIGFEDNSINAKEIGQIIQDNGAKMLTIHGRTRSQYYAGNVNLDVIKEVKETLKIPVIGNGNVIDYESFKKMIDYTNVDGVMIGRATLGNPWIFEDILNQDEGKEKREVSNEEKLEQIIEQYNLEDEYKGEYTAVREMRKHIGWYLKGLPNSAEIKNRINQMESKEEIIELLKKILCRH